MTIPDLQQPTNLELVISIEVAKTLNLMVPPSLLVRAEQVIE
jgi:putative ABC transport system substrate-binding protein